MKEAGEVEVSRLPRLELRPGRLLYRLYRSVHSPWHFSTHRFGRFNPTSSDGRGACYFAEEPLGAWVETFRTPVKLAETDVSQRLLTTVRLDRPLLVADLTDRHALQANATAALTASEDYSESQRVADDAQGQFDGIRWRVRHDLAQTLIGVVLFGPAGPQPLSDWPPAQCEPIPAQLVREAEASFDYSISTIPKADTGPSGPQYMRALVRAREIRRARAELKKSVASGTLSVSQVIVRRPWGAHSMTMTELLMSQYRWGPTRCRRFLPRYRCPSRRP